MTIPRDWFANNFESPRRVGVLSVTDVVTHGTRTWIVTGFVTPAQGRMVLARLSPYGPEAWQSTPITVPVDQLTVDRYGTDDDLPYSTDEVCS